MDTPPAASLSDLRPIGQAQRVYFLDALRGFAILGIFIANLPFFAGAVFLEPEQLAALPTASLDRVVNLFDHIFIEAKFYSIFSLLFGIGFGLQMQRAAAKGLSFPAFFSRRLGWLLLIGLVHLLFWIGDILFLYALTGFVLLLFRNLPPRKLLIWAGVLLLMPVCWDAVKWATGGQASLAWLLFGAGQYVDQYLGTPDGILDLLLLDRFPAYFKANFAGIFYRYGDLIFTGRFYKVLAMFLVGLWVVKSGLLADWENRKSLLQKVLLWGLLIGIPANVGVTWIGQSLDGYEPVGLNVLKTLLHALGVAPLSLAYVAGLALLWSRAAHGGFLRGLAPVGRMALSNYLLQTVIGISLFYGIGLGLAGSMGAFFLLLLALVIFAGQIVLSAWLLRRFRFGPAEWLWRSLTYGRRQPMRKA